MNSNTQTTESNSAPKTSVPADLIQKRQQKKKSKAEGRRKRSQKLKTDKEFAKTYFEAKSKKSSEKKSVFRKKKSRKK